MNPKQKALELEDKFSEHTQYWDYYNDVPLEEHHSVKCAIIAVDEIIEVTIYDEFKRKRTPRDKQYWQEVKQELEKML